jgi:predicted transglutaminase-like cysteine proteinase
MASDLPFAFCNAVQRYTARLLVGGALVLALSPGAVQAQVAEDGCRAIPHDGQIRLAEISLAKPEPAAGPALESKAAAILGGTRSKLEEMRLAQAGVVTGLAAVQTRAITEVAADDCAEGAFAQPPALAPAAIAVPANAILGTLSVAIKHSPFDRDWAAVNGRGGAGKVQAALAASGARQSGDRTAQVEAVNRWVNRRIEFGEDRDVYGRADYWAPAAETLRRGVGDCEDFAIAKMELLSALGISRDNMRLVVARDLVRNADHAVLVVTLADRAVMLDNMTDRLLDARLPNDYRPIMSFSQNEKWVHGYAVQPARPVRMASAAQPVRELPDVLTVTREPEMPALSMALLSAPLVLPTGLSARV